MRRDPLGADRDPAAVPAGGPASVGELLTELSGQRGWHERLEGARVHEVWNEAAGAELARHVHPVRLHGGVLVLEASSAAWATQVRYLAGELAKRVNDVLGNPHVTQVRVVTGARHRRSS